MSLPFAAPSFVGLPTSDVKQVDVYGGIDPELKNSLTSKISAFDTNLGGIISSATKMVKGIGKAFTESGMDLPTAQARIREALGGSRGAINDLSEMVERGIMGDLTGVDQGTGYVRRANTMIDSVKIVMDGVDRTFINNDYKNVSSIIDFIGDLAGNQLVDVFDLGAEAALIKGVLSEVTRWGIPELVDETFGATWNDQYKRYDYKYDDDFRFGVTKRVSDSISPTTDLAVIERLMLHGGMAALIADNPNFPEQLIGGYQIPEGCHGGGPYPVMIQDPAHPDDPDAKIPDPSGAQTVPNYFDQGRRLVLILNQLKPEWFYAKRKVNTGDPSAPFREDTVWNLQYLSAASEGFKTVTATQPDIRDATMSAQFYRVESGKMLLKQMYPYITIA